MRVGEMMVVMVGKVMIEDVGKEERERRIEDKDGERGMRNEE